MEIKGLPRKWAFHKADEAGEHQLDILQSSSCRIIKVRKLNFNSPFAFLCSYALDFSISIATGAH